MLAGRRGRLSASVPLALRRNFDRFVAGSDISIVHSKSRALALTSSWHHSSAKPVVLKRASARAEAVIGDDFVQYGRAEDAIKSKCRSIGIITFDDIATQTEAAI